MDRNNRNNINNHIIMDRNNINNRKQLISQKTEFNRSLICHLPNIFKCSKCKHNNTVHISSQMIYQICMFCGNPNYLSSKRVVK